ncbi:MAG: DUF2283 domain-containing protein [Acidobacteriota bacterium]|nr:DUF2283 domain-containing protein [Acidobacteriota bacterium]MDQ5835526.1 DUF2283 domain-containing protein [Acidobacteriota bacterium]
MRINYYPETDSLYIDLSSKPSADSREVSEGIVLDYDEDGNLVGIDIDEASTKLEIRELILSNLPAEVKQVA